MQSRTQIPRQSLSLLLEEGPKGCTLNFLMDFLWEAYVFLTQTFYIKRVYLNPIKQGGCYVKLNALGTRS
jgi:hypothetical protein